MKDQSRVLCLNFLRGFFSWALPSWFSSGRFHLGFWTLFVYFYPLSLYIEYTHVIKFIVLLTTNNVVIAKSIDHSSDPETMNEIKFKPDIYSMVSANQNIFQYMIHYFTWFINSSDQSTNLSTNQSIIPYVYTIALWHMYKRNVLRWISG